jgi:Fic-DOC domain mobile mystery protein B
MIDPPPSGGTPIDGAELDDLIPSTISTQQELNQFEQANILEAHRWLRSSRNREVLNSAFLKQLHRRMFDQTWRWAGDYRKSEKNIGVSWPLISSQLEALCHDVHYWVQERSFPPDEIAVRFHHRLVSIHCFANGNGRHARLAADCLIEYLGGQRFSWSGGHLYEQGKRREKYIAALKAADQNDLAPLLAFARA